MFRIQPQEFHVLSDRYTVRTRVPMDELTDEMVAERARNSNLTAGDIITVQCFDHDYRTLWAEADYRVVQRTDEFVSVQISDREIRQGTKTTFVVERKGEWWTPRLGVTDAEPTKARTRKSA